MDIKLKKTPYLEFLENRIRKICDKHKLIFCTNERTYRIVEKKRLSLYDIDLDMNTSLLSDFSNAIMCTCPRGNILAFIRFIKYNQLHFYKNGKEVFIDELIDRIEDLARIEAKEIWMLN